MRIRNIVLNLCLTFIKALWFIITMLIYNFINTLQMKLTDAHNIETVDSIIEYYQKKRKGKDNDD